MGERFPKQTAALRDFFASVDASDLRTASEGIARSFGIRFDSSTDWVEVEYDFNRLFVGPAAVPAPPYASAYEPEPSLMGEPALAVREVYRSMGLAVANQGATPDDHLAFELDAMTALNPGVEEHARLMAWMVEEHMGFWVPRFAAAVRAQEKVSDPVRMAVEALSAWLEEARAEVGANIS